MVVKDGVGDCIFQRHAISVPGLYLVGRKAQHVLHTVGYVYTQQSQLTKRVFTIALTLRMT